MKILIVNDSEGCPSVQVVNNDGDVTSNTELAHNQQVTIEASDVTVGGVTEVTGEPGLPFDIDREGAAGDRRPLAETRGEAPGEPGNPDFGKVEEGEEFQEPESTDAAEEKADELGVDINDVEGTGKDGRVTVSDVEKHDKA